MKPYYQDDVAGITIYHGDCREVLPTLDPVGLIVTDPPYFQPAQHYVQPRGDEVPRRSWGDVAVLEHAFSLWASLTDSVLSSAGSAYWFCDGQSYPLIFRTFHHLGRIRPLVWDKVASYNGYTWRHQHELVAWIERKEAPRVPTGDGDVLRCRAVPVGERLHPAEKPAELCAQLIAKHDRLVLDPFMGSGATMEAARSLGRGYIGIEIEERYCEIALQRLAQGVLEFGE